MTFLAGTNSKNHPLRVGIGGPVGSGKTALVEALCKRLRDSYDIYVITNDIYTKEDQLILTRAEALPAERIMGVETGGCPHTAIREDASMNLAAIDDMSVEVTTPRTFVQSHRLRDGRTVHVLAEGRLLNLAAAEGHPAAVMDMSFANQALAAEMIARNPERLPAAVHRVPLEVDREVARLKLEAMGVPLQKLTPEQERYLDSWEEGT